MEVIEVKTGNSTHAICVEQIAAISIEYRNLGNGADSSFGRILPYCVLRFVGGCELVVSREYFVPLRNAIFGSSVRVVDLSDSTAPDSDDGEVTEI